MLFFSSATHLLSQNFYTACKHLHVFLLPALGSFDVELRSILSMITNINFGDNDPSWSQATLPVKFGGLGFRSAVQLAPSAFLASAAGSSDLVRRILPSHLQEKLDFSNAFNSLRRDKMLEAVGDLAPSLYRFVHSAYALSLIHI